MGKMEKQPRINRRKLVICIVKTIIISAIAILFVMPLIWMGLSALKTTNEVFAHDVSGFYDDSGTGNDYSKIYVV